MKKIIIVILLSCLLFSLTDARIPKKGDHVQIMSGADTYYGNITDISNGLLCLDGVTILGQHQAANIDPKKNFCIGMESIDRLSWPDESW